MSTTGTPRADRIHRKKWGTRLAQRVPASASMALEHPSVDEHNIRIFRRLFRLRGASHVGLRKPVHGFLAASRATTSKTASPDCRPCNPDRKVEPKARRSAAALNLFSLQDLKFPRGDFQIQMHLLRGPSSFDFRLSSFRLVRSIAPGHRSRLHCGLSRCRHVMSVGH